ncbi:hypothetical protein [Caulobacter mirabilis]|uniref:Glycerophosphoryl diester phosphodiesterase membrane domain-containing protein n=1 Tax=Caulobacter mirabilis TaxID=69666 RepID=A0A2D2AWX6_9CAUL|nr:hypothetical protein [Caulobacter mirabilis]ATQ42485.1 hypothetical protein CSW64_08685 [Caulobacter mirabilis]
MISITDAAFSGFRAAREHPRALLVWIAAFSVLLFALTAIAVSMGGPMLIRFLELALQPNPDPAQATEVMARIMPMVLTLIPLLWGMNAMVQTVVCRVVLRPAEGRAAFLGLGRDELLQLAVVILTALILFAVNSVTSAAGAILGGFFQALMNGAGFCLWVVVSVKLSLANAVTFDTGRIGIGASWRLTTGRFWPILGSYLFAIVLSMIVFVAVMAIFSAVAVVVPGLRPEQAPDLSSVGAYFTPVQLLSLPFAGAVATLTSLILYCPAVEIYRQLKAAGAAPAAV